MLIVVGTLSSAGAALSRYLGMRSSGKGYLRLSQYLSLATFLAVSAAFLFLAFLFLSSDMAYYYVWRNSSTDLSGVYKLSGLWAGAQGSFLLWVWLMTVVLAVEAVLERRARREVSHRFTGILQMSIAGTVFLFLLLLIGMRLFERTPALLLGMEPDGAGMKMVLQTPEMVFHPPVVFAGYAFCLVPLAAGASYFLTGETNWVRASLPWARLAWVFLTLGIGIGAIWAYYVLGWGGYWGWDPVETSSLLPWLIVTAFLHTQLRHARKGEYGIASPMLGILSFAAVVFAAFATRAGGLWASSVHSFGTSEGATAGERLGYLLRHDTTVLGIFSLMVLLFVIAVYLAYDKYRRSPKPEEGPEPEKISEYVSDRNNMLLTIVLLVVTAAVMLLLLFKNLNVTQQANYDEFNQKLSMFFAATMMTLSICLVWKFVGKAVALYLGLGMIAVSIGLAAYAAVSKDLNWVVAVSLPSYLVAVGVSAFKLVKTVGGRSLRKVLQRSGPQLVHLGVALVLMSYVVSSNMQTLPKDTVEFEGASGALLELGDSVTVGSYTVRLLSLNTTFSPSSGLQTDTATVEILKSGSVKKAMVGISNMYGPADLSGEVGVYIYKGVFEDLYVDFQKANNSVALVQVKIVPFMNTLWIGFGLLVVGLSVRTLAWRFESAGLGSDETR